MTNSNLSTPDVINYDGEGDYTYRRDFWEGKGRDYEDRVERIALQRLLQPATGKRLLELGAGFGRLSSFFSGYEQVILLDYAKTQLEDARSRLGDEKYVYVAANIYQLPIADGACDAATMIRVLHHFRDVPAAFQQIRAALSPGAVFILEHASKRNLKAVMRYLTGRQQWNPFSEDPIEFVKLHFDFHPTYIKKQLQATGFEYRRSLPVSYFRLEVFKRLIPLNMLVAADALMQQSHLNYAPSIFTQNYTPGTRPQSLPETIFKCPACNSTALRHADDKLVCEGCGAEWAFENGVYDFREPLKGQG